VTALAGTERTHSCSTTRGGDAHHAVGANRRQQNIAPKDAFDALLFVDMTTVARENARR
jgi:hypothetical protein